jgi:uncharacterized protein YndB with AHSA1/START domain
VPVDVETEIVIDRPREEVARFAADPDTVKDWYRAIEHVAWESPPPLAAGTRLGFVARFLGRRISYTYEIRELVAGERLVMRTDEGPFPMETTYTWQDVEPGATRMTLRNRGEPTGFGRALAPVMGMAVRRANRQDLRRLKEVLERPGPGPPPFL